MGSGVEMNDLKYTNEFLKKLEPFIVKNDLSSVQEIKETLALIAEEKVDKVELENIKTKTNEEIYMTQISLKSNKYSIFWTLKAGQKIVITLTKDKH